MPQIGRRLRLGAFVFLALLVPALASAQCVGRDLFENLDEDVRTGLYARAHAVPHAEGNLWRATRAGEELVLVGTFHLGDSRHDATMARLAPHLARAATLLVEAGPKEQEALQDVMVSQSEAMFGESVPSTLPKVEARALEAAMQLRGFPPAVTGRLRPWFLSMMLALPPCAIPLAAQNEGLDQRLITAAQADGLTVRALEPFDTALRIFDDLAPEEQIAMVRQALALEPQAEDLLHTGAEAYFAGQSRLIWELNRYLADQLPGANPQRNARDLARLEEVLINDRNRRWIPVLTEAVAQGPAIAAFGALHLAGEEGVLSLLAAEGFTIAPLPD